MELVLKRRYGLNGTNGELLYNSRRVCYTIELPWKENKRQVSCIPEGKYKLTLRWSLRFGWHLLVNDVPGRTYILVHAYNNALKESKGCIAPVAQCTGEGTGSLSRLSLKQLLDLTDTAFRKKQPVFLTIKSANDE